MVKDGEAWWHCNDKAVVQVNLNDINKLMPYVLFYQAKLFLFLFIYLSFLCVCDFCVYIYLSFFFCDFCIYLQGFD